MTTSESDDAAGEEIDDGNVRPMTGLEQRLARCLGAALERVEKAEGEREGLRAVLSTMEAELTRYKDEFARSSREWNAWQERAKKAEQGQESLRAALVRYGQCDDVCAGGPCVCGLDKALKGE